MLVDGDDDGWETKRDNTEVGIRQKRGVSESSSVIVA
jgi:hypothetical protein